MTDEEANKKLDEETKQILRGLIEEKIDVRRLQVSLKPIYSTYEKITSEKRPQYKRLYSLRDILRIRIITSDIEGAVDFIRRWVKSKYKIEVTAEPILEIDKGYNARCIQ